jgi:signal transduction histidine kinase
MTLKTRLALWYGASLSVLFLVLLAVFNYVIHRHSVSSMDVYLDSVSKKIKEISNFNDNTELPPGTIDTLNQYCDSEVREVLVQMHTEEGGMLFGSHSLNHQFLPDLTSAVKEGEFIKRLTVGQLRVAEYYFSDLHVQLAVNVDSWLRPARKIHVVSSFSVPVILIAGVLLGYVISSITLRPLLRIQRAASSIDLNSLNQRLEEPPGPGELTDLSKLFNQMLERLEQSFKQIQRFTADAAHEIRTPLTVMRLQVEKLCKSERIDKQTRVSLQDLTGEILRLDEVLEQLLVLAKAEAGVLPLMRKEIQVDSFIEGFAEDALVLCEQEQLTFALKSNQPGNCVFDESWIRQVLFNLLSNALKYSPPNTTISMESEFADNIWIVKVLDQGPGVPDVRINSIFERFVRARPEDMLRSGSGLGLAISQGIVQMHSGKLVCKNSISPDRGFIVRMEIPCEFAAIN